MIDETKLYRVTYKDEDGSGSFLAVHVMCKDGMVSCWDTNRHRLFRGTIKETRSGFTLKTDDEPPREMKFVILTLPVYNKLVRPHVVDSPTFQSDAEMHEFYRRNF